MAQPDETTITITPDVAGLLHEAIAAEGYGSASDAIRDAILFRRGQRDDLFGYTAEEIDRLIDEADASGPAREIDIEEIKRDGFRQAGVPYPGA